MWSFDQNHNCVKNHESAGKYWADHNRETTLVNPAHNDFKNAGISFSRV